MQVKKLEEKKNSLANTSQAEVFQLKKDVVDSSACKNELQREIDGLRREMSEAKSGFEGLLAAKDVLLEKVRVKSTEERKDLEAKDKNIGEMSSEIDELARHNNELSKEVGDLKDQLRGCKRTWDQFKEGMDEKLLLDEQPGKRIAVTET